MGTKITQFHIIRLTFLPLEQNSQVLHQPLASLSRHMQLELENDWWSLFKKHKVKKTWEYDRTEENYNC